ncbi:rhomboid family intramembrane serine protease [Shimia abyssi]|uniref:Membrane associated rhomboid family serine protease n=1 Tax=Shimia abyssi TaxID=1662395 RepID=A0A2P8FEB4_9RHOB|nr:rhomboid family intramembrane serine protease [Shimia abyssi]PSL20057.1 membrane associated rhomboid family serine protease [Shimia abyssi]
MFPIRDHNPSGRTPIVVYALLLINVVIFLAFTPMNDDQQLAHFYQNWALIPGEVYHGYSLHTLISSMFLHGGWMHLLGNMLFLWIFGDNMEDEMGHVGFLIFYVLSGLGAGAAQIAADPYSNIPMIGASGAIAGVMGGYLLMFPKARVDVILIIIIFFKIFTVRAWIVLGIWFAIQLFGSAAMNSAEGGVAYWAHAGGFVAGVVLALPLWLRQGGTGFWRANEGHPPHPETKYRLTQSSIPKVRRRR